MRQMAALGVEVRSNAGTLALREAAMNLRWQSVKDLMNQGVDLKTDAGALALEVALKYGQWQLSRDLAALGAQQR